MTVTIYHDETTPTSELANDTKSRWAQNEGIAFISEIRSVDIPAGDATIEFRGVASTIVPQTAEIEGLPEGVAEQNFDYDLLSPSSLLMKSIGRTVELVRTDSKTGRKIEQSAIIRSGPSGTVLDIGGKIEALKCSGLPEGIMFENIPRGLRDAPTLSVRTHAMSSGHYTLKLSYIATGINWSADYVARIRPDGKSLNLSGFITLANFSDTKFSNAAVEVVAGTLETTGRDRPVGPETAQREDECWPTNIDWIKRMRPILTAVGQQELKFSRSPVSNQVETVVVTGSRVPNIEATRLGDYKLYALPERTSLASHQMKQVQFIQRESVAFEKEYSYSAEHVTGFGTASVTYRMKNSEETGLGKPLPAGDVSVIDETVAHGGILVGQNTIIDIARGLPIEINTSGAMDVRVSEDVENGGSSGRGAKRTVSDSFELIVENDKSVPIPFEFRDQMMAWEPGAHIVAENVPHTMQPKGATWRFTLGPGERRAVHYTVETSEPER